MSECSGFDFNHILSGVKSVNMKEWTKEDVAFWLKTIGDIDDTTVNNFLSEKIRGRALSKFTVDDLKKYFKDIPIGDACEIIGRRDEYLTNLGESVSVKDKELDPAANFPIQCTSGPSTDKISDKKMVHELPKHPKSTTCLRVTEENSSLKGRGINEHETPLKNVESDCSSMYVIEGKEQNEIQTPLKTIDSDCVTSNEIENTCIEERGTKEKEIKKYGDKYEKGSTISFKNSKFSASIDPIHCFQVIEKIFTKQEILSFIRETLKFVSACLNGRTNGTIHFGMERNDQEDCRVIGTLLHQEREKLKDELKASILKCFAADQIDFVLHCISQVRLVPISSFTDLFVVEIDVISSYKFCEGQVFFVKLPTYIHHKIEYENYRAYIQSNGNIHSMEGDELVDYMKSKEELDTERKLKEKRFAIEAEKFEGEESVNPKICDLLCHGNEMIPQDIYRILVLSKPPKMSEEILKSKMSFLNVLDFKMVFDFDEECQICDFLCDVQNMQLKIISSLDCFGENSSVNLNNKEKLQSLQADILHSAFPSWIFVNGHKTVKKLSPFEWKKQKREAQKDALRFLNSAIPDNRALVIFMFFSDEHDVFVEASEEFILTFQDQWICISETQDLTDKWADVLFERNVIEKEWQNNCITDISLEQLSEHLKCISKPNLNCNSITLLKKDGTYVSVPSKVKNEFTDLEILSVNECDTVEAPLEFIKQQEIDFYKGGLISWWNFRFNHVLERDKLKRLIEKVEKALKTDTWMSGRFLEMIQLYHQAGAGGTTLAMHALWKLRQKYRGAIVNEISDPAETAAQILKLWSFGEDINAKQVLVLLDNHLDDEKIDFLLDVLEEKAKHKVRFADRAKETVLCVLLRCVRQTRPPKEKGGNFVVLEHELTQNEKLWFERKYEEMEKTFDPLKRIDPRMLISFNIMKSNFDEKFIERMAGDLIQDITDEKEKRLLKYIAILNSYDTKFQTIPTAAFDGIMQREIWTTGLRFGRKARENRWESKLSSPIKLLLNQSSQVSFGYVKSLRITSPLLSKLVLKMINALSSNQMTAGEMVLEFINTKEIFDSKSFARKELLKVIQDILKHRETKPIGLPQTKFSPLIQEINDNESTEMAGEILEKGFGITRDPFVAQQIARLYIHASNWGKALEYARKSVEMKKDNSFLWDTYGRIYLKELGDEYKNISHQDQSLDLDSRHRLCRIAMEGIDKFKKGQECTKQEMKNLCENCAAYFGELETIQILLNCLSFVEGHQDSDIIRSLIESPSDFFQGKNIEINEQDLFTFFMDLGRRVDELLGKLFDEQIQLREDNLDEQKRNLYKQNIKKLEQLKSYLDPYFGEIDEEPEDATEKEKCKYRRRQIFRLNASNMSNIFGHIREKDGEEKLLTIKEIIEKNVESIYATAADIQTLICVCLALLQTSEKYKYKVDFFHMVLLSQKLYDKRHSSVCIRLEPYLFFVMFNWPQTAEMTNSKYATSVKDINHCLLTQAISEWQDSFFRKYPKQREGAKPYSKKETTIFFFANGNGLNSIRSSESLKSEFRSQTVKGEAFWNQPMIQRELKIFDGILISDGDEVQIILKYKNGNKYHLKVPTSLPIRKRNLWNKKVYFYLGFSWRGPKAYNVSQKDPTEDPSYMTLDHSLTFTSTKAAEHEMKASVNENHQRLLSEFAEISKKLKRLNDIKEKQSHTNKERKLLKQEEELIRKRIYLIKKINEQKEKDIDDIYF